MSSNGVAGVSHAIQPPWKPATIPMADLVAPLGGPTAQADANSPSTAATGLSSVQPLSEQMLAALIEPMARLFGSSGSG
jgi:hypothetical protein